jgi:CBS domain containing-hemolysin-like protein
MEHVALDVTLGFLAILALVFANGFFVAAEFAIVTVRRTRIDQLIAEGNRLAVAVRRAVVDPESFIAATQLGITMASLGLGWIGEPALASAIEPGFRFLPGTLSAAGAHTVAATIAFALITSLHIVLGELAPKTIALQQPERTALFVTKPTELFMKACWPFIKLLNNMGRAVVRLFGLSEPSGHALVHSQQELKMLVTASQEAGVLEEKEEQMLHRVFDFADQTAGQVMVPRTELVAIRGDAPVREAIDLITKGRYRSLPVYGDDVGNIAGLVDMSDLLRAAAENRTDAPVSTLVHEALTVPETMALDDLLAVLRRQRAYEAIVIDEYGSTAGLVTFEYLMDRIIGEPESGPGGRRTVVLSDGSALVDGLVLVTDVNEQFGLKIDEGTYTTLGGFVAGRIGRKPRLGDTVEEGSRTLMVEALDGMRVARVRISRERKPKQNTENRIQKTE